MPGGIEILPGTTALKVRLDAMKVRASNAIPAFEIIDRSFIAYESKKFALGGPGWAPLAASTVDRKSSGGYPMDILVRGEPGYTEGLKQSLTSHGSGSLYHVSPLSVTMGTSVSYAHWHQSGTNNMPSRKLVDLDSGSGAALVVQWYAILQTYVVHGAAEASAVGAVASLA